MMEGSLEKSNINPTDENNEVAKNSAVKDKISVVEGKVTYTPEAVKEAFMMPAEEVLNILSGNPDTHKYLAEYIAPEVWEKLKSPSFVASPEYKQLVQNIDSIAQSNTETLETVSELFYPIFTDSLQKYLKKYDIDITGEEIKNSIVETHLVPLDIYRYLANVTKHKLSVSHGLVVAFIPQADVILVNLQRSQVTSSKLSPEQATVLEFEFVNTALCHEFLHSLSYQNLWRQSTEINGKEENIRYSDRRSGLSNTSIAGTYRLNMINEAVTQQITTEIAQPLFENTKKGAMFNVFNKWVNAAYPEERKVLEIITQKVSMEKFLMAYFSKRALLDLGKDLREKFGLTLEQLSDSMENEKAENEATTYPRTKALLGSS